MKEVNSDFFFLLVALSDVTERTLLIWSSQLKTRFSVWANQSEKRLKRGMFYKERRFF